MEKFLPYITAIIAIFGFVFSVWKYIDLKNREEVRLNFEQFIRLIDRLQDGNLPAHQLATTIYLLKHFKNYKNAILPLLDYISKTLKTGNPEKELVNIAIKEVKENL